ncbi:MerR family transcriptional regulator [Diplocloster agilis]|uniref:MerR family transcriptional regulator n=1 Tax=Diplocloster agilis TaxID=2850323 RepID=A0A949K263_9FIRM|nr:MerR family transcriptional regulator [Diplocloster agilis]MBU9738596.1 MerR family transcriptional regulator [Diplocloster agilis]MBU9746077.1 MerR family transcriptional regulator [Diplocloster agilis]
MEYTIQKLARLAGITTRTLRYYDEIGLLAPARLSPSGYRIYQEEEVNKLQEILFYREMDLPLAVIRDLMTAPDHNRAGTLKEHLKALKAQQEQLELVIANVEKTIEREEGKRTMTDQEKFEGLKKRLLEENEEKYGEEIRESYGEACVEESNRKMMNLTKAEYDEMNLLAEQILSLLEEAVRNHEDPKSEAGLQIALLHRKWLSFPWTSYTLEAHRGVVDMYLADPRFTKYYDRNLPGCAKFLRDAVYLNLIA